MNCLGILLVLIIGECRHRSVLAGEVEWQIKRQRSITRLEFDRDVRHGSKLVILDEMVIDIGRYMNSHPGGRFVLQQNVGRDISKFFYGGYCLEDN